MLQTLLINVAIYKQVQFIYSQTFDRGGALLTTYVCVLPSHLKWKYASNEVMYLCNNGPDWRIVILYTLCNK